MHPAFSVIVFTTLSGAGFGLLAWCALLLVGLPGGLPRGLLLSALLLGFLLASAGLLSSLLHLGQPLRAWRAFSQWRSSWLSREGVLAVLALTLAAVLAALVVGGASSAMLVGCALLLAGVAVLTVYATAMIYRSLKTVPAWHQGATVTVYVCHALFLGLLWFWLLAACNALAFQVPATFLGAASGAAALWSTLRYWRRVDRAQLPSAAAATGLLGIGTPKTFERPHTEESFITREMIFVVARRHALRLRRICILLLALALALVALNGALGSGRIILAAIAVGVASLAVLVQRWLFFAEARHVVGVYFGAATD